MNIPEKSNSKRDFIEIPQTLSGSSPNEKSVYYPSVLSIISRLKTELDRGVVISLSSLFKSLGLDECANELEAERDRDVQSTIEFLNTYKKIECQLLLTYHDCSIYDEFNDYAGIAHGTPPSSLIARG